MVSHPEEMAFWNAYLPTIAKGTGVFLLIVPVILYFGFGLPLGHLGFHLLIAGPFSVVPIYGVFWIERRSLSAPMASHQYVVFWRDGHVSGRQRDIDDLLDPRCSG